MIKAFRNKKGMVMIIMLSILFVFFILPSLFIRLDSKQNQFERTLGEIQMYALETYQTAEKTLFFIDQAAKYSIIQAIYDMGQNGGFKESPNCGSYFGYSIWNHDSEGGDCYPDVNIQIKDMINDNLNQYLLKYSSGMPINNYNYLIKTEDGKSVIYGFAIRDLNFDIVKTEKKVTAGERSTLVPVDSWQEGPVDLSTVETKPGVAVSYEYFGKLPSRKRTTNVNAIILHHTGDSKASQTYKTLRKRELSVHYIIDKDGTIYYVVDEKRLAFHAYGHSGYTIGIEIVNSAYADDEYTPEQYDSIRELGMDIAKRWPDIEWDNEHVFAHYQKTTSGKWDPSPNFEWEKVGLSNHLLLGDLGRKSPCKYGWCQYG